MDNGADMNLKNENEETPFLKACSKGHIEYVGLLLVYNNTNNNYEIYSAFKTYRFYKELL